MTSLLTITTLGSLLTGVSRGLSLSRRFSGPWIASWACNERGDDFAWSSATDPEAAVEELAYKMEKRARARRLLLLKSTDPDDRELAEAIRLVLLEIDCVEAARSETPAPEVIDRVRDAVCEGRR